MKSTISESWEKVRDQYKRGRINSERTMQALLFRYLQDALPEHTVFCEPGFEAGETRAIPDVLVTQAGRVVAAVELKFVPHWYPVYEDDLSKLAYYAKHRQEFSLALDPSDGKFSSERHYFSDDCLLVFGAIGKFDASAVDCKLLHDHMAKLGEFGDRFIALTHAVGAKAAA